MRKLVFLLFSFAVINSVFAHDIRIEKPVLSGINTLQSPLWGNDVVISNFEPIGPVSAIVSANGTIYVAINDTIATSNLGLIIMQSTNNGTAWSLYSTGLNIRSKYGNIKFVPSGIGPDSIYLFCQIDSTIYSWNFLNMTLNTVLTPGHYTAFDAVGASTGALYAFVDVKGNDSLQRFSSINGGFTWSTRSTITATGAFPKLSISPGDTLAITYYSTPTIVGTDTTTATIKLSRYRQLSNGTIGVITLGTTPSDLATETLPKNENMVAMGNGTLWFLYTTGAQGNINIKGRCSRTGGRTYSDSLLIAANPNTDEYWFDIKYNKSLSGGFDFIYYSDSLQNGTPTNNTDKILYSYASYNDSTSLGLTTQVSQHPPKWSGAYYKPVVLPLTNDAGVIWVGIDGNSRKLYWDKYSIITNIGNEEVPLNYSLSQNYPNPFNPVTKINFSIPKNGLVTMKLYSILGQEVATLVNGNYAAGTYSFDFNASKLSSGVYFYSLEVNGFRDVKKMMLVK